MMHDTLGDVVYNIPPVINRAVVTGFELIYHPGSIYTLGGVIYNFPGDITPSYAAPVYSSRVALPRKSRRWIVVIIVHCVRWWKG